MDDLSIPIHYRLRQTLLRCGPFDNDNVLRATFNDLRLRPWYHKVSQADTPEARVNLLIDLLQSQSNAEGENALVLFLRVLTEQHDPDDACHRALARLAVDVARGLQHKADAGADVKRSPHQTLQPGSAIPPPRLDTHIAIDGDVSGQIALGSKVIQKQTKRTKTNSH